MFNREFHSYETLLDAIHVANNLEAKQKIRVPLTCIIDYKGFRALILAVPPIVGKTGDSSGLSYGFHT